MILEQDEAIRTGPNLVTGCVVMQACQVFSNSTRVEAASSGCQNNRSWQSIRAVQMRSLTKNVESFELPLGLPLGHNPVSGVESSEDPFFPVFWSATHTHTCHEPDTLSTSKLHTLMNQPVRRNVPPNRMTCQVLPRS